MQRTLKYDQSFFPSQVFSVFLSLDSIGYTFLFMNGSFVAPKCLENFWPFYICQAK